MGLIPKNPQILGMLWGRGQPKFWGFIEVHPRKTPNFGDGDGVTGLKIIGDSLGTGNSQILGIFGEKSPKIPKFWGGDRGRIIGDFHTTSVNLSLRTHFNWKDLYSLKTTKQKNQQTS